MEKQGRGIMFKIVFGVIKMTHINQIIDSFPPDLRDALSDDRNVDQDVVSESYVVYSERQTSASESVRIAKNQVISHRLKAHNCFGDRIDSSTDFTLSDLIVSHNSHSGYIAAICNYINCSYEQARRILREQRDYVERNGLPEEIQEIENTEDPELSIIKAIDSARRRDNAQIDMLDLILDPDNDSLDKEPESQAA